MNMFKRRIKIILVFFLIISFNLFCNIYASSYTVKNDIIKNTKPVILKNGKAKKTINLRNYLIDAKGEFLIEEQSKGLKIESKHDTYITVSANKIGTYRLKLKNNRNDSKYKGFSTEWFIHVVKPSGNFAFIDLGEDKQLKKALNDLGINVVVSDENTYTKSKLATISLSNINSDMDYRVTVSGKSSGKIDVKKSGSIYKFDINKNDVYKIKVEISERLY